jgi:hypothetical protein
VALDHPKSIAIRLLVATALVGAALAATPPAPAPAAPSVTITSPADGSVSKETAPRFSGTGEELAGVVTLHVYAGSTAEGTPLRRLSTTLFGVGGVWSLGPVEPLEDGLYTATAEQTNPLLQRGISAPVSFTVDTAAPVVTLEQPQPAPGEDDPSFTGTASDIEPVTVQVHAGGSAEGTVVAVATAAGTGAGWHSSPANPALAVGRYTAVAVQESSLGNPPGWSPEMTFEVTPPAPAPPAQGPAAPGAAAPAQAVTRASTATPLMSPFPVVRIAGVWFAGGVDLRLLRVQQAPPGALVTVRCRGRGCPRRALVRRVTVAGPHGVPAIAFPAFERFLHTGAVIEVFVSKAGVVGKYTRLRVRRGKLPERVDRCLPLSSLNPLQCPAA